MNNWVRNKNYIKYLIISLSILAIIIIILLIFLSKRNTKYVPEANGENYYEFYATTKDSYFDVNACMTKYLNAISIINKTYYEYDNNGDLSVATDEEGFKEEIYSILSNNYINKNDIDLKNLYNYVETLDEKVIFVPLEIGMLQNDSIQSFIVYGLAENIMDLKVEDKIFAVVNIDIENNVFSIEPIYGEYNSIKEIKLGQLETEITINNYNNFSRRVDNYEETCKDYINLYKRLALGYPEKMYQFLDEEYRTKKFGSKEAFIKYVEQNRKTIMGIRLEQFKVNNDKDYTEYVCLDQYGNYYIFIEKGILDYSVMLDTYTVNSTEFIDNYYGIQPTDKIALNIEKIFNALNDKDYNYIYNKLAQGFKEKYFPKLEDFEDYMKENFFDNNEVEFIYYEKESEEYYSHTIKIKDKNSEQYKIIKIIMNLKEATNFEFSFNVN